MIGVRGRFGDLTVRLVSAVALSVLGLGAAWAGGWWFLILAAAIAGAMVWELVRLIHPGAARHRARLLGALAAAAVLGLGALPGGLSPPLVFAPALAGLALLRRNRSLYMVCAVLMVLAAYGLVYQRETFGFTWVLWLILVVVATDVFGYFAGRLIGGPKFWPRVSPKKTWSGTVAGWIAAAAVAAAFMAATGAGPGLIGISVALSMASQLGDIAESAVKRKAGVKDASALIPGHGGMMDRFDGMMGASVFLLIVEQVVAFPPGLAAAAAAGAGG